VHLTVSAQLTSTILRSIGKSRSVQPQVALFCNPRERRLSTSFPVTLLVVRLRAGAGCSTLVKITQPPPTSAHLEAPSPFPNFHLLDRLLPRHLPPILLSRPLLDLSLIMGDPRESSSYSVIPRIRYNTVGGVNGPLVILENVRRHARICSAYVLPADNTRSNFRDTTRS
jgi:hypothetical protein